MEFSKIKMFITGEKKWDQDINTVGGLKDVVLYESCYRNAPSANAQQGKISSGINHYVFSPPLMDITVDVPHESGYNSNRVFVDYNNKIQQMVDFFYIKCIDLAITLKNNFYYRYNYLFLWLTEFLRLIY
jgi:hypothetical protein